MPVDAVDGIHSESVRDATGYRYYVLGVLTLLGLFAWIDRQILSMVLQPIKVEFSLTDTELGLIGGVAFGLFYVTAGLPVGWLADRFNRRSIIAAAIATWSAMTMLCGATGGFSSLFWARVGVGVGEAGVAAPSQSMLADYFPPQRRAVVMGVLYSYIPVSYLVSFGLGGWLNDALGWRSAFVVFGLPGLFLALLVRATVREPPRRHEPDPANRIGEPASLLAALRWAASLAPLRRISLAGASHAIGMVAASVWLPSFFIRVHHLQSALVGAYLAVILGLGGLLGTLTGGHLACRLANRRGYDGHALFCGLAALGTLPFTLAMYLSHNASLALMLFVIPSILNHMLLGPTFATVQDLSGARHRAFGVAVYLFAVNLISMGLGPVLIGFISDSLHAQYGADGLRYSLLVVSVAASLCAGGFYLATARSLRSDLGVVLATGPSVLRVPANPASIDR